MGGICDTQTWLMERCSQGCDGSPEGKRPRGRPRRERLMDLRRYGSVVVGIRLAQDRAQQDY
jgi:hypothetical protein